MRNPLLDLEFLRNLDLMRNKATYAKIILLTWNEDPVYEIQGKITAGSLFADAFTISIASLDESINITFSAPLESASRPS
jgi:hypothetical protein